jgi:hypothetical protein
VRHVPTVAAIIAIVFAVGSVVAALRAARLWYESSKIRIEPAWNLEVRGVMEWFSGAMTAFHQASRLNRQAVLWTAAAVALGVLSAVVSALPAIIIELL